MKKVLFNAPYCHSPAAIRYIVASWEEGFRRNGYEFHVCDNPSKLENMARSLLPDILYSDIVATPVEQEWVRSLLVDLRAKGAKVCMNVFWPLVGQPEGRAAALQRFDVADIYCGEREPDSMESFVKETGKQYLTMPQSANPRYNFDAGKDPRFAYDVVFLGSRLPHKRWFNENVIAPLRLNFRMGLFGAGWSLRDNTLRALSKASRLARLPALARQFDQRRFSISDDDEKLLYSSAKICINFHERDPDLSQPHHIVNQRTFKIAACGGFQIVDPVKAMGKYFGPDEIVTAGLDAKEWQEKVRFYLSNEDERRAIQERATARALREHMAPHRVELLERWFGWRS